MPIVVFECVSYVKAPLTVILSISPTSWIPSEKNVAPTWKLQHRVSIIHRCRLQSFTCCFVWSTYWGANVAPVGASNVLPSHIQKSNIRRNKYRSSDMMNNGLLHNYFFTLNTGLYSRSSRCIDNKILPITQDSRSNGNALEAAASWYWSNHSNLFRTESNKAICKTETSIHNPYWCICYAFVFAVLFLFQNRVALRTLVKYGWFLCNWCKLSVFLSPFWKVTSFPQRHI